MSGQYDDIYNFKDEKDAEQASEAIRKLERVMPNEYKDESDPYAQAFNRSTMTWQRFQGGEDRAEPRGSYIMYQTADDVEAEGTLNMWGQPVEKGPRF